MRLFRNYVYYHFIFSKINKRGAGIRAGGGGWKIFHKLISGGGDDYSVLESKSKVLSSGFCVRDSEDEQRALQLLYIYCSIANSCSSAPESNKQNPRDRTLD